MEQRLINKAEEGLKLRRQKEEEEFVQFQRSLHKAVFCNSKRGQTLAFFEIGTISTILTMITFIFALDRPDVLGRIFLAFGLGFNFGMMAAFSGTSFFLIKFFRPTTDEFIDYKTKELKDIEKRKKYHEWQIEELEKREEMVRMSGNVYSPSEAQKE